MELQVRYPTTERKWISKNTYQNVYVTAVLKPSRIIRSRCGRGAAENRYHYDAEFTAPDNAEFVYDGVIRCNIIRKNNPHFNPKKLTWIGNIADV